MTINALSIGSPGRVLQMTGNSSAEEARAGSGLRDVNAQFNRYLRQGLQENQDSA